MLYALDKPGIIKTQIVFIIFKALTTLIDVKRIVIPGINIVEITIAKTILFNGNSSLAKAQPAIEFINSEHNIEVVLSNSYNGNINFAELDKEGYSTKNK